MISSLQKYINYYLVQCAFPKKKRANRQTFFFPNVSEYIKLQGHIALDQAVFPENTPGFVLDAFARSSLWKSGLDYRHGILQPYSAFHVA